MRRFLPEESTDNDRGLITIGGEGRGGGRSRSKIVPVANISLTESLTNLELFIADLLLAFLICKLKRIYILKVLETISLILLSKELYETLPSESVCFALLLNFGKIFFPVALLPATHTDVCNFGRSGESEILLKGSLKGLLKVLFEL